MTEKKRRARVRGVCASRRRWPRGLTSRLARLGYRIRKRVINLPGLNEIWRLIASGESSRCGSVWFIEKRDSVPSKARKRPTSRMPIVRARI